mgnify:CR=1 FL=1
MKRDFVVFCGRVDILANWRLLSFNNNLHITEIITLCLHSKNIGSLGFQGAGGKCRVKANLDPTINPTNVGKYRNVYRFVASRKAAIESLLYLLWYGRSAINRLTVE